MSISVAGEPYTHAWPLPGGAGKYLETLGRILDWIDTHPHAMLEDIVIWFAAEYHLKNASVAHAYIYNTLCQMGYLHKTRERMILTPAARHYLQTRDGEFVLGGYLTECRGAWHVLNAVKQIGLADAGTVHKSLEQQFPQWESNNPFAWRLDWLLSLSCLEKVRSEYRITPKGEQALHKYTGPDPNDPGMRRRSPKYLDRLQHVPQPPIAPHVLKETSRGVGNIPTTSSTSLQSLVLDLKRTALSSEEATEFEKAVGKAFHFLGLKATHKSGSGDTDILLEAPLGEETYFVVVDGKSSKHGKITTSAINWAALNKHRRTHKADYILVVAPGFSSGDLYAYAKENEASLITADELCEVLSLHSSTPFSLADLRHLFSHPDEPADPLRNLRERHNEIRRLQQLILETIQSLEENAAMGSESVSAEGLYHILRLKHRKQLYTKTEIEEALSFLESSFVGALRRTQDAGYVLQMSQQTILRRLEAQIQSMGLEQADESPNLAM